MSKCYVVYEHYDDIADILKVFSSYEDAVEFKMCTDIEEIETHYIRITQPLENYHYGHMYRAILPILTEFGLPVSCTIGKFWEKVLTLDLEKIKFYVGKYFNSTREIKEVDFV